MNWYLNPYTRLMFNYIYSMDANIIAPTATTAKRISGGDLNVFEMRFAMDF